MRKEYIKPNIEIIEFSKMDDIKMDTSSTFGDLNTPGDTIIEF